MKKTIEVRSQESGVWSQKLECDLFALSAFRFPLFLGVLCVLAVCTGCNTTTFDATKPDGTKIHIVNNRLLWTTDSYAAELSGERASLNANKSKTDTEALKAVVEAAVTSAAAAAKP